MPAKFRDARIACFFLLVFVFCFIVGSKRFSIWSQRKEINGIADNNLELEFFCVLFFFERFLPQLNSSHILTIPILHNQSTVCSLFLISMCAFDYLHSICLIYTVHSCCHLIGFSSKIVDPLLLFPPAHHPSACTTGLLCFSPPLTS